MDDLHRTTGLQDVRDDPPLRDQLGAIQGVDRVVVDAEGHVICLLLRPNADADAVQAAAREIARADYCIELAFPLDLRDRQRVRFVDVQRDERSDNVVAIHVLLEWDGTQHRGTAVGERGGPIEVRTAAAATLQALGFMLPKEVPLRLAGVKQVRAFDAEMIVVSVHRTGTDPGNLVGTVIMGSDPMRAAAIAVLSALNRLMGNYLARP
jgi:hypothetical protein